MYIKDRKIFKGDFNPYTNEVVDYKDVSINNYMFYDVPVVKAISSVDLFKQILLGLIGAIVIYLSLVLCIALIPCQTI